MGDIIQPLAIPFFTFQQIAYLIDAHDGEVSEHDFVNYCLFISFFPQLLAGPNTHHGEMLKQFKDGSTFRPRIDNISLGITVFLLGLFKKVIIADPGRQRVTNLRGRCRRDSAGTIRGLVRRPH